MRIGYVRVSKEKQNEALQMDALKKYGCDKIFHEKISGISGGSLKFEANFPRKSHRLVLKRLFM